MNTRPIKTEKDYEEALAEIKKFLNTSPGTLLEEGVFIYSTASDESVQPGADPQ